VVAADSVIAGIASWICPRDGLFAEHQAGSNHRARRHEGRPGLVPDGDVGRPARRHEVSGRAVLRGPGWTRHLLGPYEQELEDLFQPTRSPGSDPSTPSRRKGQYVRLADVRKWLDDDVDLAAELDRMVEQPNVHLKAELDQESSRPRRSGPP
jgi:hypothetical protein